MNKSALGLTGLLALAACAEMPGQQGYGPETGAPAAPPMTRTVEGNPNDPCVRLGRVAPQSITVFPTQNRATATDGVVGCVYGATSRGTLYVTNGFNMAAPGAAQQFQSMDRSFNDREEAMARARGGMPGGGGYRPNTSLQQLQQGNQFLGQGNNLLRQGLNFQRLLQGF